jgi:predicted RNase H-like nuclease (RuvC/YqgF family)
MSTTKSEIFKESKIPKTITLGEIENANLQLKLSDAETKISELEKELQESKTEKRVLESSIWGLKNKLKFWDISKKAMLLSLNGLVIFIIVSSSFNSFMSYKTYQYLKLHY